MIRNRGYAPFGGSDSIIPLESQVVVYGTSWCGITQLVRRYLDKLEISYKYLDLDANPGAANQLRWITGGYTHHPTVIVDGQALIEPSITELERALSRNGYI